MASGQARITRRGFVGGLGAGAGAAALLGGSTQARTARRVRGANDQVRLGLIGAGSRGNQLLDGFFGRDDVVFVHVADVDDKHAGETADRIEKKCGERPRTDRDYRAMLDRDDLDAVVIATPDHWHAHPTIHACQAGKDVYVEKPLAHNVAEGRAMVEAARKYKRVVAVGTQQRSSENFQKAVETVRSGELGRVFWVQTWNFENISPTGMGPADETEPPPHVDYDRWLGPAPKRPFSLNRFHLLFRWYFDYAGGMMSDWGVHLNDIVLWALDKKGPATVSSSGGILTTKDDRDTPDTLQVVYTFDDGSMLTYSMRKGNGLKFNGHDYGILFCGTDGSLMLDRSGHEIIPDKVTLPYGIRLVKGPREPRKIELEASQHKAKDDGLPAHVANFLECLRDRDKPLAADVETIHRSTNTTHLGNIAYLAGKTLTWDVDQEKFPKDSDANRHLSREYRQGYELPEV
jgi:predicted dehydrogenase